MMDELLHYVYPLAFTGCNFSRKYLVPCKEEIKLIATSLLDVEEADKVAFFPLVEKKLERRVFQYCGNVSVPRFLDLSNLSKTRALLKARALNPLIAKGVEDPEYEEVDGYPFPVFAFAHGKAKKMEPKVERGMAVGFVNYFGGAGYVIKSNLHVLRNIGLNSEDVLKKDVVVERASRVYYELYDEEVFVEDITELGLEGIKMLEGRFNVRFKIEKLGVYSISKQMEHLMKDPIAGEFNVVVIGRQDKVEEFLERFRKLNIPSYIGGKVV